jgi:pyrroline-5-carboxylate reductase
LHKYHALLNFAGQNISVLKEMPNTAAGQYQGMNLRFKKKVKHGIKK